MRDLEKERKRKKGIVKGEKETLGEKRKKLTERT